MACVNRETWMINRDLLPVKATYFFIFAGLATLIPYIAVYAQKVGLTPGEIAIIFSTVSAVSAPSRILVGVVADKFLNHRSILIVCCLLAGIIHCCLLTVPLENISTVESLARVDRLYIETSCSDDTSVVSVCLPHASLKQRVAKFDTKSITDDMPIVNHMDDCALHCCDGGMNMNSSQIRYEFQVGKFNSSDFSLNEQGKCIQHENSAIVLPETQASSNSLKCYNSSTIEMKVDSDFCLLLYSLKPCYLNCTLAVNHTEANHTTATTKQNRSFQKTFWTFYCIYLIAQIALGPVLSLIDGLTFIHLGSELRNDYGKQRLWGTAAFIMLVFITGVIIDKSERADEPRMSFIFPFLAFAIFLNIGGASVCFYKLENGSDENERSHVSSTGTARKVLALLRNVEMLFLLLSLLVIGCLSGVQETYFYYFLASELAATGIAMGVTMFVASVVEMIILFISGRIIVAVGHDVCIIVAFMVFSVRLFLYSLLSSPWAAVGVELLHCICFGLLYPTVTSLASSLAPEGLQGTAQGLIATIYFGFGRAIGAALGGFLYAAFDSRKMFCIFAAVSLIYGFFLVIVYIIKRCRRSSQPDTKANEDVDNEDAETSRLGAGNAEVTSPNTAARA